MSFIMASAEQIISSWTSARLELTKGFNTKLGFLSVEIGPVGQTKGIRL